MHSLYANTTLIFLNDLSTCRIWDLSGAWNHSLMGGKDRLCFINMLSLINKTWTAEIYRGQINTDSKTILNGNASVLQIIFLE